MAINIIFSSTSEIRVSASPPPPRRIQAPYFIALSSTYYICLSYVITVRPCEKWFM